MKELLSKIKFEVDIKLIRGHQSDQGSNNNRTLNKLIAKCSARAKQGRLKIWEKEAENNLKFYGNCAIVRNGKALNNSMCEICRAVDAPKEEVQYAVKKYGNNADFIDLEARNVFLIKKVTSSVIKCVHGFNHYGVRNALIKSKIAGE